MKSSSPNRGNRKPSTSSRGRKPQSDKPSYSERGPAKRSYTKRESAGKGGDRSEGYFEKKARKTTTSRSYGTRTSSDSGPARKYNSSRSEESRSYTKRDGGPDKKYDRRSSSSSGYEKKSYNKRGEENDRSYKSRTSRDDNRSRSVSERINDRKPYTKRSEGGEERTYKPRTSREDSRSRSSSERSYKPREDSRERSSSSRSYDRKPYTKRSESGERSYKPREDSREKSSSSRSYDRKQYTKRSEGGKTSYRPKSYESREVSEETYTRKSYDRNEYDKPTKSSKSKTAKSEEKEVRLNRYLSNAGIASRRDADKFIAAGLVKVNGKVVTEMGIKVKPSDEVIYGDQKLSGEKKVYYLMNKPKDYITTNDDPQGRKTVLDLFRNHSRERVFPIGRLDRNTTGVILLTNDGDLAQRLTHPKFGVKKVYKVGLDKSISPAILNQIRSGIELEDGPIQADVIDYFDDNDRKVVGIEIHSGRNRIVRRIFESLGFEVLRLDRLIFAGLDKKGLKRGEVRVLNEKEIKQLKGL